MPPAHRLSIQQRSAIVKLFYENCKNANLTVRLFKRMYPGYRTLNRSTVLRIAAKFEEFGTVENLHKKRSGRKATTAGPNTIALVKQKILNNPNSSIRRLSAETGLTYSCIQEVLKKKLKMKPYRAAKVQLLKPSDLNKRLAWAEALLDATDLDMTYPDYILWSDEALFHLDSHINRHNAITWGTTNPLGYLEVNTQNKAGVMVWVGMLKDTIIGPFFIQGTLTGEKYLNMLDNEVMPAIQQYCGDETDLLIFQQDGASSHYYRKVKDWLNEHFEDRWMGRGGPIAWPARSPDLSPLDYWLWSYLKEHVYGKQLRNVAELRNAIEQEIGAISPIMIHNATLNVVKRAQLLIELQGRQLGIYRM